MTLSSLTPGDIFTHAKSKAKNRFVVKGSPIFKNKKRYLELAKRVK